ncbi:hypothetical protein GGTG_04329 [Gaeumannomyces tritici R3-111a-1]|uniref:Uncharacterized protein n=1 Tax=Gaeumannomyces tritici (strain R3-111a-1) TaxID=644352 RepID=J3NST0_GAET3|nr:hypothetical protein GGTG_04329 [Gaeumannomyces tritici R3-111a-1]EJT79243.1 hypothetical protein GGTG_04329 [Gaeumannomyces tritici R3-111a-1]
MLIMWLRTRLRDVASPFDMMLPRGALYECTGCTNMRAQPRLVFPNSMVDAVQILALDTSRPTCPLLRAEPPYSRPYVVHDEKTKKKADSSMTPRLYATESKNTRTPGCHSIARARPEGPPRPRRRGDDGDDDKDDDKGDDDAKRENRSSITKSWL